MVTPQGRQCCQGLGVVRNWGLVTPLRGDFPQQGHHFRVWPPLSLWIQNIPSGDERHRVTGLQSSFSHLFDECLLNINYMQYAVLGARDGREPDGPCRPGSGSRVGKQSWPHKQLTASLCVLRRESTGLRGGGRYLICTFGEKGTSLRV